MSRRKRGPSAHGLGSGQRYALLPLSVIQSEAFCTLTAAGIRLLVVAASQYHGGNNGEIKLTAARVSKYGFRSADTLNRAIKQLLVRGLLVRTRQGGLGGKKLPSLYALGWLEIPRNPRLEIRTPVDAKNAWRHWSANRHTDSPEGDCSEMCVKSAPTDAETYINRSDRTEQYRSDRSETSLRSSPEGHLRVIRGQGGET